MATPNGASYCPVCGSRVDDSLPDLGCTVCLFQAGLASNVDEEADTDAYQFGSYQIAHRDDGTLQELGRGTMGITYQALDVTLHRKVALKVIDPQQHRDDRARERFMREARASAGLRHPNIATVHHFGVDEDRGRYFYAMELVEGETLDERVRRTGPLKAAEVIAIGRQISSALSAAEKHGVVHRDLKPGNVMLVPSETGTPEVKIIDFGLAKAIGAAEDPMALTRGGFVGSPAFASPEQFGNKALDARSDIYSLGATLWFALTAKTPFAGRSLEEIRDAQQNVALPIAQLKAARVPPRLISLLKQMLALEPAVRPGPTEISRLLQRLESGRRAAAISGLVAAALILVGAVAFFANRPGHDGGKLETKNPGAREAFLKGRYAFGKREGTEFLTAKSYFERAIELDPNYARAHAGLADVYQFTANMDRLVRDEYYAKAKQTCRRALQLDPTLAEPHASLGLIAMNYDWDWPTAEREFKRSIELNPDYSTAHHWYAFYLNAQGRFDEALHEIERAQQLDPLSSIINTDAGLLRIFAGKMNDAEEKLKEALRLDPRFAQAHYYLAWVYAFTGQFDKALNELKFLERDDVADDPNGSPWTGFIGYVYALAGKKTEAEEALARARRRCAANPSLDVVSPLLVCIGLGRVDEAFEYFEDEYRTHSTTMTSLKTSPVYASLRSDPRYADLLRRVHLDR